MRKHKEQKHGGVDGVFSARLTASDRDCLKRQVREALLIRRCHMPVMNAKTELHQPALWAECCQAQLECPKMFRKLNLGWLLGVAIKIMNISIL